MPQKRKQLLKDGKKVKPRPEEGRIKKVKLDLTFLTKYIVNLPRQ